MKFKLREGCGNHREGNQLYVAGDIVETEKDLSQLLPDKFEKVDDDTPSKKKPAQVEEDDEEGTEVDLAAMSTKELKAFAQEHQVDLKGKRKKTEVIAAIEAALSDDEEVVADDDVFDDDEDDVDVDDED